MDDFGVLTESFGLKPQGKSAPMASSKRPTTTTTTDTTKPAWNSNSSNGSFLDDDFGILRSSSNNPRTQNFGNSGGGGYGDVFGEIMKKNSMQPNGHSSSFDYDPFFKNLNDSGSKTSSMPNYNYNNKNVYDHNDDIFGGMPGLKTSSSSSSANNDDVFFAPFASVPKQSGDTIDDLLGNLGGSKLGSKGSRRKESGEVQKKSNGFDELIPGFGGRSPPVNRKKVETVRSRQSSTEHSTKSTSTLLEDPFLVFESRSTTANASMGTFSNPLEELSQLNNTGRTKVSPRNGVVYDDMDPFDVFASSVPTNGSPSRNGSTMKTPHKYSGREKADELFMKTFHSHTHKVDTPSRSEDTLKTADDARIYIPKIPPFKQPINGSLPLRPPPVKASQVSKADRVKSSVVSSIDELEEFAMGRVRNNSAASATTLKDATERFEVKFKQARELRERRAKASRDKETPVAEKDTKKNSEDDFESIFGASSRSRSAPRSRASTTDSMLKTQFHNGGGTKVGQRASSGTSSSIKKAPPVINIVDDLSSIFGADLSGGQFEEYEGETEERRRARLGRHCRTNDRVAQAVADMNQRDLQTQREQEERDRISQTLDGEIKRWAAGKEGNLRALLSSLQYVLWTESGWQPISLTDIITSSSVKKVYRKATLCIHPDKVQQKGANLEQKYVAEKVFDILKEAWNKFNKEELS